MLKPKIPGILKKKEKAALGTKKNIQEKKETKKNLDTQKTQMGFFGFLKAKIADIKGFFVKKKSEIPGSIKPEAIAANKNEEEND